MAHGHDPQPGEPTEIEHAPHESHARLYVIIFFFLLLVTALEVFIPSTWLRDWTGFVWPHLLEKGLLLTLMFIKGAGVMMFYMHLKGDRRMFGSLFVFPLIVVFGMILGFIALFQPTLW
jgi:cytochrome c oxidase subunit 4/cytochrome o ubiquinol oxidase operon protein cyoD